MVLLFIFAKRQIMRLSLKNRFVPHIPLAKDAPKPLKQRIDAKLNIVRDITFEPNLLNPITCDSKRSNYKCFDELSILSDPCEGAVFEPFLPFLWRSTETLNYLQLWPMIWKLIQWSDINNYESIEMNSFKYSENLKGWKLWEKILHVNVIFTLYFFF